jgi:CBS domain-containing protein
LIGVVSRADALLWQDKEEFLAQSLSDRVSDGSIPVGHPDDTVGFIADLMLSSDMGRIPIVESASRKLVGLVARKDLLRLRSALKSSELERRPYLGTRQAKAG